MRSIEIVLPTNQELVEGLARSGARYFVVGSTATRLHAPERQPPGDLDLVVEPSEGALNNLNAVLASLGAPRIAASPEQFAKGNGQYRDRFVLNVDILTLPTGVNFTEHWHLAEEAFVNNSEVRVRVASIATLQCLLCIALSRDLDSAQKLTRDLELLARASAARA